MCSGPNSYSDPKTMQGWVCYIPSWILLIVHYQSSGKFLKSMKDALVKPLIKRSLLDPSECKNIERALVNQLKSYLCANNLDDEIESVYRKKRRLPLWKVIYSYIDQDKGMILMLLDLNATFDTVDYDILVGWLVSRLDIKVVVLQWLNFYLHCCTQTVLAELLFGVLQGSVFGPSAVCFVCAPLEWHCSTACRIHAQLHRWLTTYISFDHRDLSSIRKALMSLECCIDDIRIWMLRNRL